MLFSSFKNKLRTEIINYQQRYYFLFMLAKINTLITINRVNSAEINDKTPEKN